MRASTHISCDSATSMSYRKSCGRESFQTSNDSQQIDPSCTATLLQNLSLKDTTCSTQNSSKFHCWYIPRKESQLNISKEIQPQDSFKHQRNAKESSITSNDSVTVSAINASKNSTSSAYINWNYPSINPQYSECLPELPPKGLKKKTPLYENVVRRSVFPFDSSSSTSPPYGTFESPKTERLSR